MRTGPIETWLRRIGEFRPAFPARKLHGGDSVCFEFFEEGAPVVTDDETPSALAVLPRRPAWSGWQVTVMVLWSLIGAASTPWVPKLGLVELFSTRVAAIMTWTLNVPVTVVASPPLHANEKNAINAVARNVAFECLSHDD